MYRLNQLDGNPLSRKRKREIGERTYCMNQTSVNAQQEKCGFPLAEKRKKRKTLTFSHTRLGVWVQVCGGFQVTGLVRCQFLFCHPPLPDMPHPPTREVLVECVK